MKRQAWTPERVALLETTYTTEGPHAAALALGTSVAAVCTAAHKRGLHSARRTRALFNAAKAADGLRLCGCCNRTLPVAAFYFHEKYGRPQGYCRECIAARTHATVDAVLRRHRAVRAGGLALADALALWTRQKGRCFYSKQQMTTERNAPTLVSIDRLDSSLGYATENCVLCCYAVNMMKGSMSVAAFRQWCQWCAIA